MASRTARATAGQNGTMSSTLLTDEVGAAIAGFFFAGDGPRHMTLTRCFTSCGLSDVDPYNPAEGVPNKEQRVLTVCRAARGRPGDVGDTLLDQLLTALRVHGTFTDTSPQVIERVQTLRRALMAQSATLDDEGRLLRSNPIDLGTGGRPALDEQLSRLRHNVEDSSVLLGGAKELLESICKLVLEEQSMLPDRRADFDELLALALDRLQLQPHLVDVTIPGGKQVRAIYQSAKTTASTINELRNLQGTGHGRTLPPGISRETGRYVIREATHVAELLLSTHDRQMGRST
ncbi:hypothetical protein C1706_07940 [Propioniciclava flava]|uniref:Abortive infection protein-like C-terminal domain-containing protein n=2 Tax=Propioniciclava flava TaxID=2072026 RepID=A0A4Q2EG43_9ACTN|nr:hypothetical protein C1706_07940 [Propioniciclava flava]